MFKELNQERFRYIILAGFVIDGILAMLRWIDTSTSLLILACILGMWAIVHGIHYFQNGNSRKGWLMTLIVVALVAGMVQ